MVASNMQETDRLSLDLELEEEAHMHRYWPEGLTEEEADAIELSEEQVAELQRRGRELDARHSARHNELELEVLRAWGGEAMVKSIGSNSDEHFERTEIGYAMVFGGEVGVAVAEVIPMWFPPTLRSN
jgi:hypothetical protein